MDVGRPFPGRVLIVDDDQYLLRTLVRLVERAGYHVESCTGYHSAKTLLTNHPPDVLIADVRLGEFNGLQLVARAKLARPETAAIVLTGFDDPVMRDQACSLGATYLVKPVTGDRLIETIGRGTA